LLYAAAVTEEPNDESLMDRLSRQGEEALGKLTEELISNPMVNAALSRALDAREKAAQAQEAAMGALGIPSAADVERLTRRLRSVSQRLEGIEDALDRLEERLQGLDTRLADQRNEPVERRLEEIARDLAEVRRLVAPGAEPAPLSQERLTVSE
jgi:chromosome segregation ATPase